jgi:hypothetical protein
MMLRKKLPKTDAWDSEAEMGARVVAHLKGQNYTVYQEVIADQGTADIVAVRDGSVVVVECKLHLNLHLMEQAYRWRAYADSVFMAFPGHYPKNSVSREFPYSMMDTVYPEGYPFACHLACRDGVGYMLVGRKEVRVKEGERVHVAKLRDRLLAKLHPLQQTMARAGSNEGEKYTPYKVTRDAVVAYVKKNPGCSLSEVVANVPHHYGSKHSFRSSFIGLISKGVIPEIRIVTDGSLHGTRYTLVPVIQAGSNDTVSSQSGH